MLTAQTIGVNEFRQITPFVVALEDFGSGVGSCTDLGEGFVAFYFGSESEPEIG